MSAVTKTTLSVSQALLLLIKKYQTINQKILHQKKLYSKESQADRARIAKKLVDNLQILERLKELYLSGAKDEKSRHEITQWLSDKSLSQYQIPTNIKVAARVIDQDPTRRYFETHLAYNTFHENIGNFPKDIIESIFTEFYNLIPKKTPAEQEELKHIHEILNGRFIGHPTELIETEYSECIKRIDSDENYQQGLKDEDREKLKNIVRCCFLGVTLARLFNNELLLGIYSENVFQAGRGRIKRYQKGFDSAESQHMGILRGTMPVPRDIARTELSFTFTKPSDQSTFALELPGKKDAEWVELNFNQLVHPFSNAISGTLLCQLRVILELKNKLPSFKELHVFSGYLKNLISLMLYNSGGHSLFEFLGPIMLRETQNSFKHVEGFKSLNLETLFHEGNEQAFEQALARTIEYNDHLLQRGKVLKTLEGLPPSRTKEELTYPSQAKHPLFEMNRKKWMQEQYASKKLQTVPIASMLKHSAYYVGNIDALPLDALTPESSFLASRLQGSSEAKKTLEFIIVTIESNKQVKMEPIKMMPDGMMLKSQRMPIQSTLHFDTLIEEMTKHQKEKLITGEELRGNFYQTQFEFIKESSLETIESFLKTKTGQYFLNMVVEGYTPLGFLIDYTHDKNFNEIFNLFLKHGADPNVRIASGEWLLAKAADLKDLEPMKRLLGFGAKPDILAANGQSLLVNSMFIKGLDQLKLLLDRGASPNFQTPNGQTPLMIAIQKHNLPAIKMILGNRKRNIDLNKCDRDGNSIMMYAARYGNPALIELLFKIKPLRESISKISGKITPPLEIQNRDKDTPLMLAVKCNNVVMAKSLMYHGAKTNIVDAQNNTLLMVAIEHGLTELVETLLQDEEVRLQLPQRNVRGHNAIHMAIIAGNREVLKKLLDINNSILPGNDRQGYTLLMLAAVHHREKMVDDLLTLKDVQDGINHQSQYGDTALALAVKEGNVGIVKNLLALKADPNGFGKFEHSPLAIAVKSNSLVLVKLLLNHGAKADIHDVKGNSLIHLATKNEFINRGIIKILSSALKEREDVKHKAEIQPKETRSNQYKAF